MADAVPSRAEAPLRSTDATAVDAGAGSAHASHVIAALALSLLLPALLALATWMPVFALAELDTDNLAIVWIDGTPAAQAGARALVANEPAFAGGGDTALPGQAPAGCAGAATRLHFEVRRNDEVQATRRALEALATAAGARVCASDFYELNVPVRADREPLRWLRGELWQALMLLVLPAGLVLLAFAAPVGACAWRRLQAEAPPAWQRPLLAAALVALLLATAASIAGSGIVGGWQPAPASGLPAAFALHELALVPLLHQLALRTWLFAHLQPQLPLPAVVLLSIAAGTAAMLPMSPADLALAVAVASACTALYLRTRTLLPAVVLHALAIAVQDALLIAG